MARRPTLGRNVLVLSVVSFLTDASSEIIYPLLPLFLTTVLGAGATTVGAIEGVAESTAALLKLASGWWSDRLKRRKPLVVAGYALASAVRPLVAFAQSSGQVLAIRLGDRVGKGIRTSPRDALIAESVDGRIRGRAFGVHRAADNLGAVVGPLIAFVLLGSMGLSMRTVFLIAAIPAVLSVIVLVAGVRETVSADNRDADLRETTIPGSSGDAAGAGPPAASADYADFRDSGGPAHGGRPTVAAPGRPPTLGRRFWGFLAAVLLFTLGNSTDAFLLLRAQQLGVPIAMIPILWAVLSAAKSVASVPGGALSDRLGRKPLIVTGWAVYSAVYLAFAHASAAWHVWVLFIAYGLHFGLTEGTERAMVADLAPIARRGLAYGWYNLGVGIAALPASIVFGLLWDRYGAATAFKTGATLAVLAAIVLLLFVPSRHPQSATPSAA
ncbi:MAG TPA: MFS transporter [Gemmatimonadaceae bacterium]|nr:MFS transporter [Gemmatimonadaceae bacterium]